MAGLGLFFSEIDWTLLAAQSRLSLPISSENEIQQAMISLQGDGRFYFKSTVIFLNCVENLNSKLQIGKAQSCPCTYHSGKLILIEVITAP